MARKASRMSTAEISKQFGMTKSAPQGKKVKLGPPAETEEDLLDPTDELDPRNQKDPEEEEPAPKKKGAPVITNKGKSMVSGETKVLKEDPKFPGRKTIAPPTDQFTLGRRRAPSSEKTFASSSDSAIRSGAAAKVFAERKGKKGKYVAPPIEDIIGEEKNPFTKSDLDFAQEKAVEAAKAFDKEEEENPAETPSQKKAYGDALDEFERAMDYAKSMRQSISLEMARLQRQLDRIEADQEAMEMCDTSFFDNDQANYYNDYADSLRDEKKKVEDEMDRIQGEAMKKKTMAKRSATKTKSRRLVKRRPSATAAKPRRRKSTSSGRRSPGSPARSR